MIPQTVPKRPMKGAEEAVVARKAVPRLSTACSTPIARRRLRSTPSSDFTRKAAAVSGRARAASCAALTWASISA